MSMNRHANSMSQHPSDAQVLLISEFHRYCTSKYIQNKHFICTSACKHIIMNNVMINEKNQQHCRATDPVERRNIYKSQTFRICISSSFRGGEKMKMKWRICLERHKWMRKIPSLYFRKSNVPIGSVRASFRRLSNIHAFDFFLYHRIVTEFVIKSLLLASESRETIK